MTFSDVDGNPLHYNYSVAYSPVSGTDVVANFIRSCQTQGLKTGFYYSVGANSYLNVANGIVRTSQPDRIHITQTTYNRIVLQQLTELWTLYGPLTELWFDGGFGDDLYIQLKSMIAEYQPDVTVFNGCAVNNKPNASECLSPSSTRWIGNELGHGTDPCWSSGVTRDAGDPTSPIFAPAECPTTLQADDKWFWVSFHWAAAGATNAEPLLTACFTSAKSGSVL